MADAQVFEIVGVAGEAAPADPPAPALAVAPVVEEPVTYDDQIQRLCSRRGMLNSEKKALAKTLKTVRKRKARLMKASKSLSDADFAMMARIRAQ